MPNFVETFLDLRINELKFLKFRIETCAFVYR